MLNKLTQTQYLKGSVISIIAGLFVIVLSVLKYHMTDGDISWAAKGNENSKIVKLIIEITLQISYAIFASALFAIIYGSISKNREAKEIADLVVMKVIGTYPIKAYPAATKKKKSSDFDKDLKITLIQDCKEFYYYEGVNLKTACSCLEAKSKKNGFVIWPEIHLFISQLSKLPSEEKRNELLESIKRIITIFDNQPEMKIVFYILPFDTGFHVHLMDNHVWFSPFRGVYDYPTTYLYKKEEKNTDSYYYNIRRRFGYLKDCSKVLELSHEMSFSELFSQLHNALNENLVS